ncbi:MAG: PAS domain-containing protein [Proteobacteria bacterium]|nr:PAS domain-containing protein [Pseudomonadota bacterium]
MPFEELRYHGRLRQYWDDLRGKNPFPHENQVNPDEIEDIWSSCFLISIDDVTRRIGYRYSYMGQDLLEAYGSDPGQDSTSHLVSCTDARMVQKFDEVVKSKMPVTDEAEFVNSKNLNIRYRTCILPLDTANGEVTHLLGCMRWKMY